jgi:hypothetical protein
MATTTNYGWDTPDDTDLVKDGAAAIRTLGSSIDTTTKALNPSTTLGDIEYRSSTANTNTRLALGTAGQVLQVNAGATAPEWATVGSSATSYALLNAGGTALTGATTITVSSLSGYNKLFVRIDGASSASASSEIYLRLNSSSANYSDQQAYIGVPATYTVSEFGVGQETNKIGFTYLSNNAGSVARGYLQIDGCNSTGVKTFTHAAGANSSGGNSQYLVWGGGTWTDSAVVSSISIISGTGNFDAGTIFIFGAN